MTKKQRVSRSRSELFFKLHGLGLSRFINNAIHNKAITKDEEKLLNKACSLIEEVIHKKVPNSRALGIKAFYRCSYALCNNKAKYIIDKKYYCKKHGEKLMKELDNYCIKYNLIIINKNNIYEL